MKAIFLRFTAIICCILLSHQLIAQKTDSNIEIPTVIPSSPQSQIFEKYVNHAITEYNGLPDITIPLYEIEINGLKIPIALTYHASGIKYKQHDGEVGAGWSINAGGYRITRTVKGLSDFDFDYHGYEDYEQFGRSASHLIHIDYYLASMMHYTSKSSILPSVPTRDGEHDIFTYMTPSTNGNFIISNRISNSRFTATPFGATLDKISINKYLGEVIDGNGFSYSFGENNFLNNEHIQLSDSYSDVTAWPLKKITSPYKEAVYFYYKTYRYKTSRYPQNLSPSLTVSDAAIVEGLSSIACGVADYLDGYETKMDWEQNRRKDYYAESPFVTKIESERETVYFERIDLNGEVNTPNLISRIVVTDKKGDIIKVVTFTYNYNAATCPSNNNSNWHILLNSIKIENKNSIEKEYGFEYNPSSQAIPDYWSYYGSNTSSAVLFIPLSLGKDQFVPVRRYSGGTDYAPITLESRYPYNVFVNRYNSLNSNTAFSLKKIIFPTGGYTEYEYESNRYTNLSTGAPVFGVGMRIKEIRSYQSNNDTNPLTTSFKYGIKENGVGTPNVTINDNHFWKKSDHIFFGKSHMEKYYSKTYSNDVSSDVPYDAFTVYYPEVSTYHDWGSEGKTVSAYEIPIINTGSIYKPGLTPILISQKHYKCNAKDIPKSDSDFILVQEEKYNYEKVNGQSYQDMNVEQNLFVSGRYSVTPGTLQEMGSICNHLYGDGRIQRPPVFKINLHAIINEFYLPKEKITTQYSASGNITTQEIYDSYDSRYRLTEKYVSTSGSEKLKTSYSYPANNSYLASLNILATVVEELVSKSNGQEIKRTRTNYSSTSGSLPLPLSVDFSLGGNIPERELTYDEYGRKGTLVQYTGRDGVPVSFLWGYDYKYPIIKVLGATYSDILDALFPKGDDINESLQLLYTPSDIWQLHFRLRNQLPNAQVFGYSYKPLIGLTSEISPDGISTYYKYDTFGRLFKVLDNNQHVLNQYDYHYAGYNHIEPAEWAESTNLATISISGSPSSGGMIEGSGSYTKNTTIAVTATPHVGYTFDGWYEGANKISSDIIYSFTVTANRTLQAKFTQLPSGAVAINLSTAPIEGGVVSGNGTYNNGSNVTVAATPNVGYTFDGWYENSNKVSANASYSFIASTSRILQAKFYNSTIYSLTLSATPTEGGAISGNGDYYAGSNVTVLATPNAGYIFDGWYESANKVSSNTSYSFAISNNLDLQAKFVPGYTISAAPSEVGRGTVSGGGIYSPNSTVTVHAVPNSGYFFDFWYEGKDEVSFNPTYSFTATANRTLLAQFRKNSGCTISASASPVAGGTVSGSGTYEYGMGVYLHATCKDGYIFDGWYEGSSKVSTNLDYSFTATANRTLQARFITTPTYTISVAMNPGKSGYVTGGGVYKQGSRVTLNATPDTDDGYGFSHWYEGANSGNVVCRDQEYIFTATADRTLTAQFTQAAAAYLVSVSASPLAGGTVSGGGSYNSGTKVTLTAKDNKEYEFFGWYEGSTRVSRDYYYTFTVTRNVNLVAKFDIPK